MIENEMRPRHVGQIRGDVLRSDLDLAVLHVFRMDEQDVVDQVQVLEEDGAYEAIEIAAGDEAVTLGNGRHWQTPFRYESAWAGAARTSFIIPRKIAD